MKLDDRAQKYLLGFTYYIDMCKSLPILICGTDRTSSYLHLCPLVCNSILEQGYTERTIGYCSNISNEG